ncbi:MAG: hypothetical protein B6D64_06735 [Bacteroidetes bacterium 4484_276]|nr:MAG: hypothetical protein B6D64_06735 [Bacteroidetes bacterium 4484_276]
MNTIPGLLSVFGVFQDKDAYFEMLGQKNRQLKTVLYQTLIILLLSIFYGLIMGSYNSPVQAVVTGIKVPSLLILALFICFPALYVIQFMLGSKMGVLQMMNTILSGFVVFATIMASFAPIVIFFMITGNNYSFLKLLHVGIFIFSGAFGMRIIIEALKYSCEKKNVYPKIGINIFKFWIVIFAFVGVQLAWNLRPFVGDKNLPLELFREKEGNFYLAVFHSADDLFGVRPREEIEKKTKKRIDKEKFNIIDTTQIKDYFNEQSTK